MAMDDTKDEDFRAFDGVEDDVLPDGKTADAGAEFVIAAAAEVGVFGKEEESVCDGVYEVVGDLDA